MEWHVDAVERMVACAARADASSSFGRRTARSGELCGSPRPLSSRGAHRRPPARAGDPARFRRQDRARSSPAQTYCWSSTLKLTTSSRQPRSLETWATSSSSSVPEKFLPTRLGSTAHMENWRASVLVALDRVLHHQATVEADEDCRVHRHDLNQVDEGSVLA